MSEWIKVNDKLPEIETDVLVGGIRHGAWYVGVAGLFYGEWMSLETERETVFEVTHWQELPEPPEE